MQWMSVNMGLLVDDDMTYDCSDSERLLSICLRMKWEKNEGALIQR